MDNKYKIRFIKIVRLILAAGSFNLSYIKFIAQSRQNIHILYIQIYPDKMLSSQLVYIGPYP